MIRGPAELVGLHTDKIATLLVEDALRDPQDMLPLLGKVLEDLYKHRCGDTLDLDAYERGGRLAGYIDRFAEQALADFCTEHNLDAARSDNIVEFVLTEFCTLPDAAIQSDVGAIWMRHCGEKTNVASCSTS